MVGQGPEAALGRAAAADAAAAAAASTSAITAPSAVVSELERLAIMQTQAQVGEISS